MKKIIILLLSFCMFSSVAFASAASSSSDKIQNSMTIHEWAHAGMGYLLNDQLKRHTKLTAFERVAVVAFCAYAKENWIDKKCTPREGYATIVGAIVYNF